MWIYTMYETVDLRDKWGTIHIYMYVNFEFGYSTQDTRSEYAFLT